MLWKRVIVGDQERVLMAKNDRFTGILEPGQHRIFVSPNVSLELERHNVHDLAFESKWASYLLKERPDVVSRYFTRVQTNTVQVAMVYVDGRLLKVLLPAKCVLYWRGTADITAEVIDVIAQPEVPSSKLAALERLGWNSYTTLSIIEETKTGLLFVDNRLVQILPPGKYGFWAVTKSPHVEVVDLRHPMLEMNGQEILSRDKEEIVDTCSLLNMAKLLEDNSIFVRLKELETSERQLTVVDGFEGLLDQFMGLIELHCEVCKER